MGDSFKISSFLIGNVLRTVIIEVKAIVILSIIFSIKPMALVIFILSVPLYFFLLFLCKERLYKCNLAFKEQRDGYFSHLNELLYNMKTIKIHAIYPKLKSKFNNAYYDYLNGAIDLSKISYLFTNIETSLSTLLNIVIMLYSGIQIIKGHFLVGDIVLIIIYYNELLEILRFSIKQFESYQDYKVSFDRISEIIELDIVNDGDKYIEKIKNIRLDNISFSFDKNKIFDKFSFEFEKGKIYGIKGNNGIGKSTLINLILGLYSKYSGQIYFNDYNIKDINMKQAFFKKHSIRYLQELYLR
jgi:ATP-binding cassette subfamily C protein